MKKEKTERIVRDLFDTLLLSAQKLGCAACKGAKLLDRRAALFCETEKHKYRLNKIYRAIGNRVVESSLSTGKGEESLFRLIDEAKSEREKLALLRTGKNPSKTASRPQCKKSAD